MLRILGRPTSINVRKALWTAAEAGLDVVHEPEWAASRDVRSAEFLALNPNGLVPVLVTEDGALWESNTICRYLVGRARRSDLLPAAPYARAQVEKWMDWQATTLNPVWTAAFLTLVRASTAYSAEQVARSAADWNERMLLLETHLARGGPFVCGEAFTLADVVLALSWRRWMLTPFDKPATPALQTYGERLMARPAYRAAIDPEIP